MSRGIVLLSAAWVCLSIVFFYNTYTELMERDGARRWLCLAQAGVGGLLAPFVVMVMVFYVLTHNIRRKLNERRKEGVE